VFHTTGADEEGDEGAGGAREEAAAEVDELKRKLRDKEASEARLMAARRYRSREDLQDQSQIEQLIGMASTLAARLSSHCVVDGHFSASWRVFALCERRCGLL
jgi:hypothetical protein